MFITTWQITVRLAWCKLNSGILCTCSYEHADHKIYPCFSLRKNVVKQLRIDYFERMSFINISTWMNCFEVSMPTYLYNTVKNCIDVDIERMWPPTEKQYKIYDHSAVSYVSRAHCIILLHSVGNKFTTTYWYSLLITDLLNSANITVNARSWHLITVTNEA